jgi:MFS family permease
MSVGASVWAILVGVVGAVLLVCGVLLAARWGRRRSVGAAGAGLLLLGLAVSGIVGILAQAVAVGLNPVRWLGLVAAGLGVLMLSWVGMLPGRRRAREVAGEQTPRPVERGRGRAREEPKQSRASSAVDDDLAEIEDILRRRGIE